MLCGVEIRADDTECKLLLITFTKDVFFMQGRRNNFFHCHIGSEEKKLFFLFFYRLARKIKLFYFGLDGFLPLV